MAANTGGISHDSITIVIRTWIGEDQLCWKDGRY